MSQELITIENKPKIPQDWDYQNSVKKVKQVVYKWKEMTIDLAQELWIAREVLSNSGARTDLGKNCTRLTWEQYCKQIGVERRSVHNWLNRFFPPMIEVKKLPPPPLPKGKYNLLYADPPWEYKEDLSKGATRSPRNNYPVMDYDALEKFGEEVVNKVVNKDCVLFMWATAPKLNWAMPLIEAWGFEYKTHWIWDKQTGVMGHYSHVRHELLLIGGKNKCGPTCDDKTVQSIQSIQSIPKTSKHSEKPHEFREVIDILYPNHTKLELFARGKAPKGWTFWGNEVIQ